MRSRHGQNLVKMTSGRQQNRRQNEGGRRWCYVTTWEGIGGLEMRGLPPSWPPPGPRLTSAMGAILAAQWGRQEYP